jgi:hypothetical protein
MPYAGCGTPRTNYGDQKGIRTGGCTTVESCTYLRLSTLPHPNQLDNFNTAFVLT